MIDALLLAALLHKLPAASLITLGPESSIEEQLQYAKRHWPNHFFVAVITVQSRPKCYRRRHVTYCNADTAIERLLWDASTSTRPNRYRLHYWYPRATLYPKRGSRLIAVLAPTHSNDTISPNILLEASPETLQSMSEAIANVKEHEFTVP